MNAEKQRIAIGEACGVTMPERYKDDPRNQASFLQWILPKYLSDLNAMHEAEKVLTNMQRERYRTQLVYMLAGGDVFASAAQRAEAFLRTINLWSDNNNE